MYVTLFRHRCHERLRESLRKSCRYYLLQKDIKEFWNISFLTHTHHNITIHLQILSAYKVTLKHTLLRYKIT